MSPVEIGAFVLIALITVGVKVAIVKIMVESSRED
jgi:hypothetical protein